jgi:hypothetical protein
MTNNSWKDKDWPENTFVSTISSSPFPNSEAYEMWLKDNHQRLVIYGNEKNLLKILSEVSQVQNPNKIVLAQLQRVTNKENERYSN